jgi:hypothetical protein
MDGTQRTTTSLLGMERRCPYIHLQIINELNAFKTAKSAP